MQVSMLVIGIVGSMMGQMTAAQEEAFTSYRAIPLSKKLSTPLETVQTLCFSADCFHLKPEIIDEAIACLEIDRETINQRAASLLAMELQEVINELSPQLTGLNILPGQSQVSLYEGEGIKISLRKNGDGMWRFDRETVSRIPLLRKFSADKEKARKKIAEMLRQGMEDPTETMVHFMNKAVRGDFQTAANHLDLSEIPSEQRMVQGPYLAWKLAATIQRKGYLYAQVVPSEPDGPRYNWSADSTGRISVSRVYQPGSRDLWQFEKETIRNIGAMYEAAKNQPVDIRYLILGRLVAEVPVPDNPFEGQKTSMPVHVPAELSSPRSFLKGFFLACMMADMDATHLQGVNKFMDLSTISPEDRELLGPKRAEMIEAIIRKIEPDSDSLPDFWGAPNQTLHRVDPFTINIVRQKDGCWRFSSETVARAPEMFHSLAPQEQGKTMEIHKFNNPRNAMFSFLAYINQYRNEEAARALDLSGLPIAARQDVGPVLAFKLKFILDRIGRFLLQEIPADEKLPMYEAYRGTYGTITMVPVRDEKGETSWKFNFNTVMQIERIFEQVMDLPPRQIYETIKVIRVYPDPLNEPGIWLRQHFHSKSPGKLLGVTHYQWVIILGILLLSLSVSLIISITLRHFFLWTLGKKNLPDFEKKLRRNLRAARFLTFVVLLYVLLPLVDMPVRFAGPVLIIQKILFTVAITWFGLQTVDKLTIFYEASRKMDKYRGLSNILVPFFNKSAKLIVLLVAVSILVKNFGESETLGRYLAGLGIVGLGISLAAQDSLKNLFGTLLLIGDRTFRVGDRLLFGDKEGIVEEVGFRSTKLRTPEDSILILPNGTLANGIIDNYGLRKLRRIRLLFGLDLLTPVEKIHILQEKVTSFVNDIPAVEPGRNSVMFLKVGELGLEFEIIGYAHVHDNDAERALKESILEATLRLCKELEIKPTNLKK